ncbi:hypothetical protein [Agromyces cerinus]|uniref:Uncharacterized protein n=1 Tax=Agromyces cerinus subsp. cerinus TaxID=232089 RepID=A0A1N6DHB7_9MICO|nr:hypothetical protein [Agromyces cerinus]SIN70182.1 hypothetical protein SAMN05443544_0225 [Agromyces cerinus subsp. cerinus]
MDRVSTRLAAVLFAAVLALTACVPSPDPSPTRTPNPTRTPSAAPTPHASAAPTESAPPTEPGEVVDPVVTRIVVRPEQLDLVNRAGVVVGELSYDAEAVAFVDTISNVLGGPPDVEERPGGHEWFPWTKYTWPGAVVIDDHEPEGISSDMNVAVEFTHPVVGDGISVATVQGFRPGDDAQAFAAEVGVTWHGNGFDQFPAETGPDIGERGYDEWAGTYWEYANANAVAVSLWSRSSDPAVTSVLQAPWNFGIGHV